VNPDDQLRAQQIETDHSDGFIPVSTRNKYLRDFVVMNMLDKNGIRIDLRSGSHVRIRRSWCTPLAGRSGVVLAIEPDDPYGTYLIRFEDGLQFRYERRDLEVMVARCRFLEGSDTTRFAFLQVLQA
jgi:hypothetical protein